MAIRVILISQNSDKRIQIYVELFGGSSIKGELQIKLKVRC